MAATVLTGRAKAAGSGRPARDGCCCVAAPVICVLVCLGMGTVQVWHMYQTSELRHLVQHQQRHLAALERDITQLLVPLGPARQRRSVVSGSQQTSPAVVSGSQQTSPAVVSGSQQTSPDGIPIVDRPYGYRPGLHDQRPGMRVYETFGISTTQQPVSQAILPHHRSSAAYRGSQLGRVNAAPEPAGPLHRRSRVKHGASRHRTRTSRRRRLLRKRAHAKRPERKRLDVKRGKKSREAAEARGAPTSFSPGPASLHSDGGVSQDQRWTELPGAGSRHRPPDTTEPQRGHQRHSGGFSQPPGPQGGPRRHRRLQRLLEELREQLGTTAAHLESHTSRYSLDHQHYSGNGILRNAQRDSLFVDWQFAPWVTRHGYSRDFVLQGGEITVKKPGVYYLYAQINYLDPGDINGFEMMVSGRSFAKCLTMESTDTPRKVNTCHTSGITYLETGDTVSIRDMHNMRISMLRRDRSFFGLVRLAGPRGDQRRTQDGGPTDARRRNQ